MKGLRIECRKSLGDFTLDVAWEMGNELSVLFGTSGAGKTLTLQILAGLMTPDDGTVHFDDTDYFDRSSGINISPQHRPFGYVFQDLALFPHMTVERNILYGATAMGKSERVERAHEMILAFRLEGLEDRYPAEISGGQKQRVAIARALVRRPKVLLLDEPFSSLDAPLRNGMRRILRDTRDSFDIPVVLVTHDFAEARAIADRVIVYEQGRVVQFGPPDVIADRPANKYVANLVAPNSDNESYEFS